MKNNNTISRREFLKLAMLSPAAIFARSLPDIGRGFDVEKPHVIILVFDAWSAKHVSFLGYHRDTMPNLARFLERATIYHKHYSAGTFTTPGTSSFLTGLYPWTHRALNLGGRITPIHSDHHIFSLAGPEYATLGFTQNSYADQLLFQASDYLDTHIRIGAFNIQNRFFYNYFKDAQTAFVAFENNIVQSTKGPDSSLFLAPLFRLGTLYDKYLLEQSYQEQYPRELPSAPETFLLSDIVDSTIDVLDDISSPSLLYLHFYPPHAPYSPKREFSQKFKNDNWKPIKKPDHILSEHYDYETLAAYRNHYDEYLASWDDELGRLFDYFEKSGLLESSYVIITSDHGELFERGDKEHGTPLIYEPLINIPLIISRPGQMQREDVYINTNSVDVLPTLSQILGQPIPAWSEGQLLPGFGGSENPSRSIFVLEAKTNSTFSRLDKFSMSLTRDRHRLTYYQYPKYTNFEFYNLDDDPEEMKDLFASKPSIAADMQTEILDKIADVNRPYSK